jgi:hypothetical protein
LREPAIFTLDAATSLRRNALFDPMMSDVVVFDRGLDAIFFGMLVGRRCINAS